MSITPSKNSQAKEVKETRRDAFEYPPSEHLTDDVKQAIFAHRLMFRNILADLKSMYGSNRYVSLAAQDLEAAESWITKAAEFYGRNKIG